MSIIDTLPPLTEVPFVGHEYLRERDRIVAEHVIRACAAVCEAYEFERWDKYKRGHGPERGSDYVQGQSDGAGTCRCAILALLEDKP